MVEEVKIKAVLMDNPRGFLGIRKIDNRMLIVQVR